MLKDAVSTTTYTNDYIICHAPYHAEVSVEVFDILSEMHLTTLNLGLNRIDSYANVTKELYTLNVEPAAAVTATCLIQCMTPYKTTHAYYNCVPLKINSLTITV